MIEFMLKMYITATHDLIRNKVGRSIPYKFSGQDIKNAPLERLLTVFSRLNDNIELQARLNKLKDGRNLVAHQGFILQFNEINELLGHNETFDTNAEKISLVKKEAIECLAELVKELWRMADHYQETLA